MKKLKLLFNLLLNFWSNLFSIEAEAKGEVVTPRDKRNEYLSRRGYTPREVVRSEKKHSKQLSSYRSQILTFIKYKRKGMLELTGGKNKQGIPNYRIIENEGNKRLSLL